MPLAITVGTLGGVTSPLGTAVPRPTATAEEALSPLMANRPKRVLEMSRVQLAPESRLRRMIPWSPTAKRAYPPPVAISPTPRMVMLLPTVAPRLRAVQLAPFELVAAVALSPTATKSPPAAASPQRPLEPKAEQVEAMPAGPQVGAQLTPESVLRRTVPEAPTTTTMFPEMATERSSTL